MLFVFTQQLPNVGLDVEVGDLLHQLGDGGLGQADLQVVGPTCRPLHRHPGRVEIVAHFLCQPDRFEVLTAGSPLGRLPELQRQQGFGAVGGARLQRPVVVIAAQ